MPTVLFRDGRRVSAGQVPVTNWYKDRVSAFESMRVYDGIIFKLGEHLSRLEASAKSVGISIGPGKKSWARALTEAVGRSRMTSAFVRLTVTEDGHWISISPLKPPGKMVYKKGLRLRTAATRKSSHRATVPQAKCSDYLSGVLATHEMNHAKIHDVQEVILVNTAGYVEEGRTSNLFIVKDRAVITPPTTGILDGVTRRSVLELSRRTGFRVKETMITRHDVYTADEAFLTYTSGEIVPVAEMDGRRIGVKTPGVITVRLHTAYKKAVKTYVSTRHRAVP